MRRDLVEALCDLKHRFMRFPGGCIVEGNEPGNDYGWKDTLGPVINRKSNYNLYRMIRVDLSKRWPKTKETGRNSTPVEVVLRMLWS